jgi:signal peptidase II
MNAPPSQPNQPSQIKKLSVLGLFFILWLSADLWTKHWADMHLADPRHPIAVTAEPGDAGRTIGEIISDRLDLQEGKDTERTLAHILKLPPVEAYTPQTPVFGEGGVAEDTRGFYVFWRKDASLPPRRLDRTDRLLANRWLSSAREDADPAAVMSAVDESLAGLEMSTWLSERVRRLGDDRLDEVSGARMHPIRGRTSTLSPKSLAVVGDTYLIEWRQIDVMGKWFKYVYAENQGAAFGFLKEAPPTLRDTIFFSLTLIVLLAILGIIVRTGAQHRMVLIALTAILSGAIGNFIDRIRYGYVIDFIDMYLGSYHWPTYNVADIGISCGVVLLMLDITFNKDSPLVTEEERSGHKSKATKPGKTPPKETT